MQKGITSIITVAVSAIRLVIRLNFRKEKEFITMQPIAQSMFERIRQSLVLHEDLRHFPYADTIGKITIGIGYNLTDRGLSDTWIESQFLSDVDYFYEQLSEFDWFNELNDDRKIVLLDMAFMGLKSFMEFTDMIEALKQKDYELAGKCMLDSKWADQVKQRARTLSYAMRIGIYRIES